MERTRRFIEAATRYLGRRPSTVVLFAEDYDAIRDVVERLAKREKVQTARGPSVTEYEGGPQSAREV